jgi:CRP-like cAMP-binding protein
MTVKMNAASVECSPPAAPADLLRNVAIFSGLSETTMQLILQRSWEAEYSSGSYYFHEGDQGDRIYLLRKGTAIVERQWNGRPIVLARIKQGDCFGEMSLIDCQRRFASVKAESDCCVIEIPFAVLTQLCESDMQQYTILMMNLGREVSRRLRIAGDRLFQYQQELGRHWFDEELNGDA